MQDRYPRQTQADQIAFQHECKCGVEKISQLFLLFSFLLIEKLMKLGKLHYQVFIVKCAQQNHDIECCITKYLIELKVIQSP